MEADFNIDAAFDGVVDRFVPEHVPVMKEIAAKFDEPPRQGREGARRRRREGH